MGDDIGEILSRRALPRARSNLAQRIIDTAKGEAKQRRAQQGWLEVFAQALMLPNFNQSPAYAQAMIVCIILAAGLMIGYSVDVEAQQQEENPFENIYGEDGFNAGRWL